MQDVSLVRIGWPVLQAVAEDGDGAGEKRRGEEGEEDDAEAQRGRHGEGEGGRRSPLFCLPISSSPCFPLFPRQTLGEILAEGDESYEELKYHGEWRGGFVCRQQANWERVFYSTAASQASDLPRTL
jgi:hypothetical protein